MTTPNLSNSQSPYFAAIDLGSNSFHLLIVKINDGALEIVDRVKEMVQIARGLQAKHNLSELAQARALHCLSCFQERIRDIPNEQIRVVGTKALRMAGNANGFLKEAEKALQHPIDIISGYEEARLVYLGVSHDISAHKGQRLIIDIGGGSTEFIVGSDEEPQLMESLSIGCVTFSDRFFTHESEGTTTDKISISQSMFDEAYYATCQELELIERRYRKAGWDIAIGSSGTMKAIAELMPADVVNGVITRENLVKLKHDMVNSEQLPVTDNISSQRRSVLPAGIAILSAIFDQLRLTDIHVVNATLKEGLIYDTLGRLSAKDMRDKTVNKLIVQYQVDTDQATRVDDTLRHLMLSLPEPLVVNGINLRKTVHWAALLHEIGLSISHSGYHHHGSYLLTHSDMAGFSRYEQELLALFVGTHRRKIRSERLALLTADDQQLLTNSLVFLRLAVLLNHRREEEIDLPNIEIAENNIQLTFPEEWLDHHPLTYRNLLQEQRYLESLDIRLEFL